MKIDKHRARLELRGEEGDRLVVSYDNRGDPYREGIDLEISNGYDRLAYAFLEDHEAKQLRDLLLQLYPISNLSR